MRKILITYMALAALFSACEKNNLERSIWLSDPDDIGLPQYTEWGYNSFGAKMSNLYFVSYSTEKPCSLEWNSTDSTLKLTMNGWLAPQDYVSGFEYIPQKDYMSLSITFPCDSVIDSQERLYLLNGRTIDLTDTTVRVSISRYDMTEKVTTVQSGELCFKRVQNLYVDNKYEEAIVSGTFDIRYVKDGKKTWLSDGRFDFGITNKLFW